MTKASEHSDVDMFATVLQFNVNFINIALYTINWFKVNSFAKLKKQYYYFNFYYRAILQYVSKSKKVDSQSTLTYYITVMD